MLLHLIVRTVLGGIKNFLKFYGRRNRDTEKVSAKRQS